MENKFAHLTPKQLKRRSQFALEQIESNNPLTKEKSEAEFFEVMDAYWDKVLTK